MNVDKSKYDRFSDKYDIFSEWFDNNEKKLINLFCKFIRTEKVYDIDFAHFVEYMYNTDKSCKDYNKGRIFNNEKKDK